MVQNRCSSLYQVYAEVRFQYPVRRTTLLSFGRRVQDAERRARHAGFTGVPPERAKDEEDAGGQKSTRDAWRES